MLHKNRLLSLRIISLLAALIVMVQAMAADHVADVDPFIGEDASGYVFVGANVPFGMVKLGPDVYGFGYRKGYKSEGDIRGFTHLTLSGGAGKYENIRLMPVTGAWQPADMHSPRSQELASPGYYAVTLDRYAVKAELTATRRVGVHRYTFTQAGEAHIALDLNLFQKGRGQEMQRFLGGDIKVVSPTEMTGVGRYIGGWNEGGEYDVFFDLITDTPAAAARTWADDQVSTAQQAHLDGWHPFGAVFDYTVRAGQVIRAKVGLSFISVQQAHRNAIEEVHDWDFDAVHQAAVAQWNEALARIEIGGATASQRRQFYTALFHTMMMPSDHTGENPKWTSSEPYYDDFQAIWDTFRSQGPLLTLIAPERQRDILRSLIDTYRHAGYMPDARVGNDNGRTQGGSNADVMIADAYVKGLAGIDYATAFKAMLKDAEVPPADARKEGRGGLDTYNRLGYIAQPTERAGSRTVEYAYDDFAIAELACGLGHTRDAERYKSRAGNWANLWDSTSQLQGISGWLRPRHADGSWAPQYLQSGTWPDFYYEGDLWTYSLYAPQDVRRLIALSGGNDAFVKRLDATFDGQHFDITNEPGFLIPDLYLWAGRPDRTADRLAFYLRKAFKDARDGLPGNDDSGAMSSWYAFQSMGFYPNAGQDVYLIGTPSYPYVAISLGGGKRFVITADHVDGNGVNRYVQSATLNGHPLNQAWFRHAQIAAGGTLHLVMGPKPSQWGTTTPPPSLSDPGFALCRREAH